MRKVVLNCVYELAKKDSRIVFIGSDLGAGTLDVMKKEFPDRFFMEGISEQNLIGMAAGMALSGKIVYCSTIATFLTRRAFEQNTLDLGYHRAKVRLIATGGGLVYAPLGPTHLAIDDIAIMRTIPHMGIIAPADVNEMRQLMMQSVDYPGPLYIRVAKGGDPIVTPNRQTTRIGDVVRIRDGTDGLFITTGITLQLTIDAADELKKQSRSIGIVHIPTIKPLDVDAIIARAKLAPFLITIEEHSLIGGLGSAVAEILAEHHRLQPKRFLRIALPDAFPKGYGSQQQLMAKYGISKERLVEEARKMISL